MAKGMLFSIPEESWMPQSQLESWAQLVGKYSKLTVCPARALPEIRQLELKENRAAQEH